MNLCPICGKEVKNSDWYWGKGEYDIPIDAHMECVLKKATKICTDTECLTLSEEVDCPECGEPTRKLTKKDND